MERQVLMTMPADGGMIKLVNVGSHDPLGSPRMHLLLPRESMAKMASADLESTMDLSVMPDELAQFWHDCDPDFDKHVYTHINIVSAFEYYGPNNNGDSFPEQNIYTDGYYRTFTNAHPFLLHNNSDPKLSIGKVIATGYNLKMHRIEVISRLDKDISKSIEIIARIRSGKFPDVSMGCRVPYDVCSICGKKAKTRAEYCDHAKNHLLQFYPYNDMANRGRITCVHNTKPTFFDQSFVFTRADKGTNVIQELNKAAGIGRTAYFTGFSADAGALFFKEAAKSKEAEIEKASPEDITADVSVESKDKKESEGYQDAITPELPMETCEALASHPFEDIFDTAALMGMHVMPKEYAVIDALKSGDKPRAIVIKKHVTIMLTPKMASVKNVPMRRVAYNYKVAQLLAPFMPVRSFLPRFDLTRQKTASMEKVAHDAPMVSSDYAKHVVATFMNTDWQNEFYKRADLVVACQSRIKEYAEGSYNDKEDPKIAAVRLGGAYKSFEGLRPIGKVSTLVEE